jgi:hypothetical protein
MIFFAKVEFPSKQRLAAFASVDGNSALVQVAVTPIV